MESFGKTIRKFREQAKKSMRDLAAAVGVSVVYISDIELGHRKPPSDDKLNKIADFLGLDRGDIAELAMRERDYVEIDLKGGQSPMADVALALARKGDSLTEDEANKILAIIRGVRNDR